VARKTTLLLLTQPPLRLLLKPLLRKLRLLTRLLLLTLRLLLTLLLRLLTPPLPSNFLASGKKADFGRLFCVYRLIRKYRNCPGCMRFFYTLFIFISSFEDHCARSKTPAPAAK
jgi:hypothetical protein